MQFKLIGNYINGYIKVEIEGYYIERFINTCMKNGIFLWGIVRKKQTLIQAKIGLQDIEKAKEIAKDHGCKIETKRQRGLPFLIERYKKRKIFFILLFIVLALIFGLSKFIWNIEVTGCENINSEEIINLVKENGIKIGKYKGSIDTDNIVNKIRISRDDLAWIGIEIKGTNAIVRVVEAESKPNIVDENSFTNIVATKDAVITNISAQNGTIMVQKGDSVKKGDVLIAGYMEGKYTDRYYVNSNGEAKGMVQYMQTERISKKETKKSETGKINTKYAIKFNNFRINFYKRLSKFKKYDTIVSSKKVELFSNFYLPIELLKFTNYEVEDTVVEHDLEDAKSLGTSTIEDKMKNLINGEVIDKKIDVTERESSYEIKVTYSVIENIGTKEEIKF